MTNQNNAARLTGDEIRAAIKKAHNMSGPSDATTPGEYVYAGAEAMLSKLRAEGVPVTGLPAYITDNRYHIQYRLGWNNCLSDCRAAMLAAAPVASAPADERAACATDVCQAGKADGVLCANDECDRASGVRPASAPVADNWQQYALPGETTAEQVCERMNAEVTRRTVAAMRANAPVALTVAECHAITGLIAVARAAFKVADDAEDDGGKIKVGRADADTLSTALDALDELPDDQPGYSMGPSNRAEWALRRLLSEASAPVAGEAQGWSGWACQYPDKLPRLYGAREIAELNCDSENGDRLLILSENAAPQASEAVRNADVSALLSFIFGRFGQPGDAGELPDTVAAAVRRLERVVQPQADKDGGQWEPLTPEQMVADMRNFARSEGVEWPEPAKSAGAGEPIAWESTTPAFIKYVTDSKYRKFRPGVQKWYRPYRCANCAALSATQTEQGEN